MIVYAVGMGLGLWAIFFGFVLGHDGLVAGGFVATLFFLGCTHLSRDTLSRRSSRIREEDHPHTTLYPSRKRRWED